VVLIVLWSVVPIYWAVKMSLQTEGDARATPVQFIPIRPTLRNYARLLGTGSDVSEGIRQSTVNIVIECALATIVTILLATIAAYAFSRLHFRGKNIFFYAVLATMAFPPYTTLIPLYRIMSDLGLVNTYTESCWSTSPVSCRWPPGSCTTTSRVFPTASRRPASSTVPDGCRSSGICCCRWPGRASSPPP